MPLTYLKSLGIADGTIVNADINASAAIAQSKITGSFGKVLQVVSTLYTSSTSTSSGTPSDVSGFSASITPASTSNKILIFINSCFGGPSNGYGYILLLRGSTSIGIGSAATGSQTNAISASGYIDGSAAFRSFAFNYLDSPSTTSSTTYKIQLASSNPGTNIYLNAQGANDNGAYISKTSSTITLMEIAG